MVDLVKIRKKAKERKKEKAGDADAAPAIEASSEPERKKKVRRKSRSKKAPEKKDHGRTAGAEELTRPGRSATDDAVVRLDEFKRTAGLRIADDDEEESDAETRQADVSELLTFQLGEEMFSIDVGLVEQIIVPRDWTPVPNAPAEILGIFSLRGKIVTLIDFAKILDLEWTWKEALDSRIIVVSSEGDTFGFRVDRVLRVARVEQATIQPQPVVSGGERSEMVTGIVTLDGKTISVLSVSRLTG